MTKSHNIFYNDRARYSRFSQVFTPLTSASGLHTDLSYVTTARKSVIHHSTFMTKIFIQTKILVYFSQMKWKIQNTQVNLNSRDKLLIKFMLKYAVVNCLNELTVEKYWDNLLFRYQGVIAGFQFNVLWQYSADI